ncbi:hypothetical protein MS3_00000823 [Schistosoma haematobium]|uniref:Reverse transcriptase domain-containing protein n=1 Tax=Schistosoma haematobium TaxID=6185 RepID=A0A922LU17_SCHHA|nr:hypothetical protein MS3_00000823 [Schistosoma haematobium]KAH9593683.1 hypothetical protein MS3_00000823 [Schistosoma haematobium]
MTIDISCDYISLNNPKLPSPSKILKALPPLCTGKVQFTFEGEYFCQINRVVMVSLLEPLLAHVLMIHVENLTEDLVENTFLYQRFVDDILVICEREDDMSCLLNKLNTLENHINVSCEEEKNDQLPFLDILISRREDGSI